MVCHAVQENGTVTIMIERAKSQLSIICSSVMSYLNETKIKIEVPSTLGIIIIKKIPSGIPEI